MKTDIQYLASDELEGRGLGTNGLNLAADYLRMSFEKIGLNITPAGGDPFQEFTITTGAELGEPNSLTFIGPADAKLTPQIDVDFRTCSFGGNGAFSGGI
ncbi:MAG: aminopeptidase, partial [Planctomycetaceae bacterium]